MIPEHLTNEELANWMVPFTAIDDRSSGYIKSVIDEAARRLRTSIPKPVVEVVMTSGGKVPVLKVNGQTIMQSGDTVNDTLHRLTKALGLEGGDDE